MGALEAARERSIGAWQAILDYSAQHPGTPQASEKREMTRLGERALALEAQWNALRAEAAGEEPPAEPDPENINPADLVRTAKAVTARSGDGRPAGMGNGVPFPGGNAGGGNQASSRRSSIHAESWGQVVVDAVSPNYRFQAALLSGGAVPVSVPLRPTPIGIAQRARFLREIIPQEGAPNGRASYLRQTVRTNNAAAVAPGALKPTSVYTMVRVDDRTRTVAHLSEPMNRSDLDDAALLRSFIDDELRYGLDLALDDQILNGAGTGENMTGILATSGIQTQAFATDALQSCRKAITKLQTSDLEPRAFVMNPASWEKIELLAMAQFASNDNTPMPVDAMQRSLFGVPVVVSNAVGANVALLGDFASSSILFTTQEATIDWSENTYDPNALGAGVGASDFSRNVLRFRAEGRWLIAVTRPLGFVSVALA